MSKETLLTKIKNIIEKSEILTQDLKPRSLIFVLANNDIESHYRCDDDCLDSRRFNFFRRVASSRR